MKAPRNALLLAVYYGALSLIGFSMLLPLFWMFSTSLKAPGRALTFPPKWIPTEPELARANGALSPVARLRQGGRELEVAILPPEGRRQVPGRNWVRVLRPSDQRGKELLVDSSRLVPREKVRFHWENYAEAWRARGVKVREAFGGLLHDADGFLVFYLNSLIVSICVTVGQVFTSSLAAFAFARLRFPGRDPLFLSYLATLMVPAVVTMIPVFALLSSYRLTNTYWALILPGLFSAFGTFLLRQYFLSLPRELEEAARIDGASNFAIYWRIILPLSRPALATLSTFVFIHTWNDFMWPLIVVDDLRLKTLPIGLAHFQDSYSTEYALLMAASVIVMLPVLVVFLLGQRYFVRGIMMSGLKA